MAKSRSRPASRASKPLSPSTEWKNTPFRALKQIVPKAAPPPRPAAQPTTAVVIAVDTPSDVDLFRRAVADAKPLADHQRDRVEQAAPASPPRQISDADAEALAELCDLVSGQAPFDITSTDEHIEGTVVGLDPRLLRRLRNGEFACQDHLDLHRMTTEEARPAVEQFLVRSYKSGRRCVLIIHGRGRNSKDQIPVLKPRLTQWLTRGQWAHWVLAFTTARPCDGGVGALYVLLRRQRQPRQPMRVTNGAKW